MDPNFKKALQIFANKAISNQHLFKHCDVELSHCLKLYKKQWDKLHTKTASLMRTLEQNLHESGFSQAQIVILTFVLLSRYWTNDISDLFDRLQVLMLPSYLPKQCWIRTLKSFTENCRPCVSLMCPELESWFLLVFQLIVDLLEKNPFSFEKSTFYDFKFENATLVAFQRFCNPDVKAFPSGLVLEAQLVARASTLLVHRTTLNDFSEFELSKIDCFPLDVKQVSTKQDIVPRPQSMEVLQDYGPFLQSNISDGCVILPQQLWCILFRNECKDLLLDQSIEV